MKCCAKCKLNKEEFEFNKNKLRIDGLQRYCRQCSKEYDVIYFQNNKKICSERRKKDRYVLREEVNTYKTDRGCTSCGANDAAFLDFHHIQDKLENVASLLNSNNRKKVFKEIEKCIVLCSNCHRRLHYYNLTLEELKLGNKQISP